MSRKILIFVLIFVGFGIFVSGCEKTDYQNPFHRASSK